MLILLLNMILKAKTNHPHLPRRRLKHQILQLRIPPENIQTETSNSTSIEELSPEETTNNNQVKDTAEIK